MPDYVWCKKEERRLPTFRCLLCREGCYPAACGTGEGGSALERLVKSGRYKERYVMRKKEDKSAESLSLSVERDTDVKQAVPDEDEKGPRGQRVFLLEDGKLKPFMAEEYTTATLYQVAESFAVECRLVRPEDPGNVVFEGKKPSKKTIPIIITRSGESVLLDSWEGLDSRPEQLSDAAEVIGATPVKQVFVLKRKED